MPEFIMATKRDGIGHLVLNRPDKRNAINEPMASEIIECMADFDSDPTVIVIIIEGTEGSFCAGADMSEANAAYRRGERRFNPSQEAANRVGASEKPTIAAINGPAYGAGAALACACDIRVCSDSSRFRFPGAEYGLVVGAAALPQIVGGPMAKELIFTSRVIHGSEAKDIGLANVSVPEEAFNSQVNEIALGAILPPADDPNRELKKINLGLIERIARIEEVTGFVEMLIKNDFITGERIFLDGGRHVF